MDLKTLVEEFEKLRQEVVGKLPVHEALQGASNLLREALAAIEVPIEQSAEGNDPQEVEVQEGQ